MTAFDQPADVLSYPGWYPDPTEQHHLRYFDGTEWTDHVTHHGPEPCGGCHTIYDSDRSGPSAAVKATIEEHRPAMAPTVPGGVSRPRRAPDRRRVRGRGDAPRR